MTATLAGATVTRCRLQIPAWGAWWADVDLADETTLSGRATLALGGVSWEGSVVSGGPSRGRSAYRIVGGAGGWGRDVPPQAYRDDAGVKVATVAGDVARLAGETLADVPSARMGPHYARQRGPASRVLHDVAPQAWHVDAAGVTRLALRPEVGFAGRAVRLRVDRAAGVVDLELDDLAGVAPGMVVDDLPPAVDVEVVLTERRLVAHVMTGAQLRGRAAAMARLLDAIDPRRLYRACYEYRVVTQSGDRLNLQPVRASSGMPDLAGVPVRPGMAGLRAMVTPGELVLVLFADGDPSRPQVVAHDAPDAPGWMPLQLELGAAPTLGVARQTDPVIAGPFAGTITLGSLRVKAGA